MAVKSGSDFNDSYNGSTGADGVVRDSNWEGWSDGETVSLNHAKDGHGSMFAKGSSSNGSKSANHLHIYDNPPEGDQHHKSDYPEGQRLAEDKQTKDIYDKIGDGVRNFMGW
jgi:hypothetical protein